MWNQFRQLQAIPELLVPTVGRSSHVDTIPTGIETGFSLETLSNQ
jgi:hypothetical protein